MSKTWIDFTALRARARFEPVLSHYGLTQTGRPPQVTILCPFHDEAKPSCKVNLEKRAFHCFGCGAKGNVLDFVAKMENAELPEAARMLAMLCGISTGKVVKASSGSKPARSTAPRGNRKPQETREAPTSRQGAPEAQTALTEPPAAPGGPINPPLTFKLNLDPAHPYLVQRQLRRDTIWDFGLGCCYRGMMAGRICIPIHNERGELVAYAGRWPGDSGWPKGEDKYKFPPGFRKSHVLFNLHRVAQPGGLDELVLVEGFFSVFRWEIIGVPTIPAVALMGSSLSDEQVALLAAHTRRVTVLMDGDDAGYAARTEIVARLAGHMYVRAPHLPKGASPDMMHGDDLQRLIWD